MGTLIQIRELLDDHPMAIQIDVKDPRELAAELLRLPEVVGVELVEATTLIGVSRTGATSSTPLPGSCLKRTSTSGIWSRWTTRPKPSSAIC